MRTRIGWLHVGVLGLVAMAPACGSSSSSGDTGMGDEGPPNPVDSGVGSSSDSGGTPTGNMGNNAGGRGPEAGSTGTSDGSTNSKGDGATDAGNGDSGAAPDSGGGDAGDSGQSGDASPNADAGPIGDAALGGDAVSGAGSSPCAGGMTWPASDEGGAGMVSGYGTVEFQASTTTQVVELKTTLAVPTQPTSMGTLFLWPGLQPLPNGMNYNPIGEGVLQPVLTWGTSCNQMSNSMGWWISGEYVNPYGFSPGHTGCLGGPVIDVQVGDLLDITMSLKGTTWSQLIVDRQSGMMTNFDIDMAGQAQNWAIFRIEEPSATTPVSDVVFTSSTITFAAADPMACQASVLGANDYVSPPQASMDGTKCCYSRIILRAQGVPATTPNMP